MPVLVALLVCLIPTTIGGLLSAIGIAGMDRLIQQNVIAMSGRAVEAAGDVNTLLLDKTGTITLGNRQAVEFLPVGGVRVEELADRAQLASLPDETPEGRSIVVLAKERFGLRGRTASGADGHARDDVRAVLRRHPDERRQRRPSDSSGRARPTRSRRWVGEAGGTCRRRPTQVVRVASRGRAARRWSWPSGENGGIRVLGVVHLKDVVKGGMKERFDRLRAMGIRTVMITGDNPLTAAAIAAEAGVDDFLAEATPEQKLDADPEGAGRRPARRHDRRRHQRRPGAGPGRRRRGDEHRHPGGARGGQHGGPRLQPDQAHRDRGDREAAAHDPGLAHHVLDRQRRGQVLRDHPGDVRGDLPRARRAQRHAARSRPSRRS